MPVDEQVRISTRKTGEESPRLSLSPNCGNLGWKPVHKAVTVVLTIDGRPDIFKLEINGQEPNHDGISLHTGKGNSL